MILLARGTKTGFSLGFRASPIRHEILVAVEAVMVSRPEAILPVRKRQLSDLAANRQEVIIDLVILSTQRVSESLNGDIAVGRLDNTLHILGSVAGPVVLVVVKGLDERRGLCLDGETVGGHGLDNVAESEALR
jgi:hypothetical protein